MLSTTRCGQREFLHCRDATIEDLHAGLWRRDGPSVAHFCLGVATAIQNLPNMASSRLVLRDLIPGWVACTQCRSPSSVGQIQYGWPAAIAPAPTLGFGVEQRLQVVRRPKLRLPQVSLGQYQSSFRILKGFLGSVFATATATYCVGTIGCCCMYRMEFGPGAFAGRGVWHRLHESRRAKFRLLHMVQLQSVGEGAHFFSAPSAGANRLAAKTIGALPPLPPHDGSVGGFAAWHQLHCDRRAQLRLLHAAQCQSSGLI
mmetsp:Transcript_137145/g.238486  ORF Transcript_137145/g.238486 Transcript_137145/m.238486 type:complete len:258 (+) Transcript_137145:1128-1901(+)